MSRAFVTGGSGFLGQNLISDLLAHGIAVNALARSEAARERVTKLGATPIYGDLDNEDVLRQGMQDCDTVYHAAAYLHEWGSYADAYRVNVGGTERVIHAAQVSGVARLVYVSTEAVLIGRGAPPLIQVDETRPRPKQPLGLYALTKGLAEDRVLAAGTTTLAAMVVRPRFIWGQGDTTGLPRMVQMARSGAFIWVDGGRYLTSTCHVANVCAGLMLAAAHGRNGEIYFITDDEPVEFRSFITAMLQTQGSMPGSRSIPHWLALAIAANSERAWRLLRRSDAPPLTRALLRVVGEEVTINDAKARRDLSYAAVVTRADGLAQLAAAAQHAEPMTKLPLSVPAARPTRAPRRATQRAGK